MAISLTITENSTNVANNTSSVTVKLTITGSGSWNAYPSGANAPNGTVTIDGTSYSFIKTFDLRNTSSQVLWTKTVDIPHNADGTKTLSVSATFDTVITSMGKMTTSASKALTKINRGSASLRVVLSQDSQNITANTSSVTAKVYMDTTAYVSAQITAGSGTLTLDGTSYNFTYNATVAASKSYLVFTKTVTVSHAANGTKTVSASATYKTGVYLGNLTASSVSKTLTQIPRPTQPTTNKSTYAFGENIVISLPRNVSGVTHTIQVGVDGTLNWTNIATSVGTSYTWTLPKTYAQYITSNQKLRISAISYSSSTNLGTKEVSPQLTITPTSDMAPVVNITHSDVNTAVYNKFGGYVIGKSQIKMTVATTLYQKTTITSGTANLGSQSGSFTAASYSLTANNNISAATTSLSATVKDARGLSGSKTVNVSAFSYTLPSIKSLTVSRCNQDGTANDTGAYAKISYNAAIDAVNNKNDRTLTLSYKKQSASSWTTQNITMSSYSVSGQVIISADTESTYDVKLSLKDYFTTSELTKQLSSAFVLMDFYRGGKGMAIGKVAEQDSLLDVGISTRFGKGLVLPAGAGEITENGSYAFVGEAIPSGANLNNYTRRGYYRCQQNTIAQSLSNCPTDQAFTLEVTSVSPVIGMEVYIVQTLITLRGREFRRRGFNDSGGGWDWGDGWQELGTAFNSVIIGAYGSAWNVTNEWQLIGNKRTVVDNMHFKTDTAGNITLKKRGVYAFNWRATFSGAGTLWARIATSGGSVWSQETKICQAGANWLQHTLVTYTGSANNVVRPQISQSSGGSIKAEGNDYVEVMLLVPYLN